MKRTGKQPQNTDGKAEDSVQEDHRSPDEKPAKTKRSASKSAKRIGGNVYKACGCAMPWWQCLLAWAAFIGLCFAVRLVVHTPYGTRLLLNTNKAVIFCYRRKLQGTSTLPRTGSGLEKYCATKGCVPSTQLLWCLVSQGTHECSSAVNIASPQSSD